MRNRRFIKKLCAMVHDENEKLKEQGYVRCPVCHGSGYAGVEGTYCKIKICPNCSGSYPPGWIKESL